MNPTGAQVFDQKTGAWSTYQAPMVNAKLGNNIGEYNPTPAAAPAGAPGTAPTGAPITAAATAKPPQTAKPMTAFSSDQGAQQAVENTQKLTTLGNKGITIGPDGMPRYADNTLAQTAPVGAQEDGNGHWNTGGSSYNMAPQIISNPDADPEVQQINDMYAGLIGRTDANTKSMVDSIITKYTPLITAAKQRNAANQGAAQMGLLANGTARYAQANANSVINAWVKAGLDSISNIESQEADELNQANRAKEAGNLAAMDAALGRVQDLRDKKQAAADKLNDKLQTKLDEEEKAQAQQRKDETITSIYTSGVTDPSAVYQELRAQGFDDITLADVSDSLKTLVPPGLNDLVKTLQTNGAPIETIQQVLKSTNMSQAYAAAGDFASGGTGMVGEYNFYKAQAKAAGQVPVDFDTYQDQDANRKKSIAKAGQPTFTTDENGNVIQTGNYDALTIGRYNRAVNAATSILQKNPTFKNIIGSSAYLDRIEAASQNPGSVGDQELLDAFTQLNTGGNRVTEAQVHLITGNQSVGDWMSKLKNKFSTGGALSDAQRKEIVNLSKEVYKNYQSSYKPLYNDAVGKLEAQGIPKEFWNIPNPDTLSHAVSESAGGSTADTIIQSEDQAKQSIMSYGTEHPEARDHIKSIISEVNPDTGHPYSYADAMQILGI